MIEAQKINLSLTTLRRVIDALIDGRDGRTIPYRESTLTHLLRQDLGGNSKCFMLATVSPHLSNSHESQRTLEYAARARLITNQVRINEDDTAKMFSQLEQRLWENQKRLMEEQATAEEKDDLERQMQAVAEEKQSLMKRIALVTKTSEEEEREIKRLRRQRIQQRYKVAAQLTIQNKQIQAKQEKIREYDAALRAFHEQAKLAGHHDVDSLRDSLETERDRINELTEHGDEGQRQYEAMHKRKMEREEMQSQEIRELSARLESLQAEIHEMRTGNAEDIAREWREGGQRQKAQRKLYEQQSMDAEERHRQEIRRINEEHSDNALREEQEHSEILAHARLGIQQEIDAVKKAWREQRAQDLEQLRAVQSAEAQTRWQFNQALISLDKTRSDLRLATQLEQTSASEIEAKLREAESEGLRLQRALADCERALVRETAEAESDAAAHRGG
eukprot:gene6235-2589_t